MASDVFAGGRDMLVEPTGEPVLLRDEREKRRMSREELAELSGLKLNWIRHIENGSKPGPKTRAAIRKALKICPIHRAFGIQCSHVLPVPPDEELYAPPPLPAQLRPAS